jgi:periplasmic mercuric ion binding protein
MKSIILMCAIAVLAVATVSAQPKQSEELLKKEAQVQKTVIKVPTLICSSCVATVTKALKKIDGVKTAKVDLKAKTATVTFAASKVTVNKLELAIAEAGYDANGIKRNPEAYEKLDACCKADPKKQD